MTNVWHHGTDIDRDVASIFDPFGNAVHTALSFPVLGEDVLITGAGPIGLMAAAVVRHAGARHVVITDVNPYRLELAQQDGRRPARVDVRSEKLADVQKRARHEGGLRRRPGDVRQPRAFRDMIANMATAGRSRCSASRPRRSRSTGTQVVFNMLTIKGIYGREMYETWYKMTVMLQSGLDISPVITHRFAAATITRRRSHGGRAARRARSSCDWRD